MDIIYQIFSLTFAAQVIRISVPYILAAMGGVFSERSGVINIALEGMILNGAFAAVLAVYLTGSPVAGVFAGALCGVLTACLHAVISIRFRADQIISGVAINLLSVGLTKFFLKLFFDSSSNSPRVEGLSVIPLIPGGSRLAETLNQTIGHPLVILTVLIVIASHFVLFKTAFGLRVRSIGEHPAAAATLGVKVNAMRYGCVALSGALAGLAGVWLALDQHQFTDGMSNARGFIALAAVIFGKWNPVGAVIACLLFGCAEALQITLQSAGSQIPNQFVQMLPYVMTMIALAGFMGRSRAPAAIGKAYTED